MEDRGQIQIKLMGFWVPCTGFKAWNDSPAPCRANNDFFTAEKKLLCPCKGSARLYPLRRDCPCFYYLKQGEIDWIRCLPCGSCNRMHNDAQDEDIGDCIHCDGLDYVFNDAPDALTEAINAKGWQYEVTNHYIANGIIGDEIRIYGDQGYLIGQTMVKDMLTGCAALEVALWQTMEEE